MTGSTDSAVNEKVDNQPDKSSLVRALGPVDATMIVLCTAAVDPSGRAAEIGLSRWLAKPFAVEALESLVREAARRRPHMPVGADHKAAS